MQQHQALLDHLGSGAWWPGYKAAVQQLSCAGDDASAIAAIRSAIVEFGGNGAVFSQSIRYDAALTMVRTLVVGDAAWAHVYSNSECSDDDPWMEHAMRHATAVLASEVEPTNARQRAVVDALVEQGLVSALIVPSPSNFGGSCTGFLCIGAAYRGHFEGAALSLLRPIARGLAMEISDWHLRRLRGELIERAQITADDVLLLEHEALGHSSKLIATALRSTKSTIDSRFSRLNQRLGVATRGDALRVVRLYGLL